MKTKANNGKVKELRYDFTHAEIEKFKKELYNDLKKWGQEDFMPDYSRDGWCEVMSFNTPAEYSELLTM